MLHICVNNNKYPTQILNNQFKITELLTFN